MTCKEYVKFLTYGFHLRLTVNLNDLLSQDDNGLEYIYRSLSNIYNRRKNSEYRRPYSLSSNNICAYVHLRTAGKMTVTGGDFHNRHLLNKPLHIYQLEEPVLFH